MTARLLDGGNGDVVGALSSGGTESIVLATKAARDKMFKERGITRGEVVACATAHAAIDKVIYHHIGVYHHLSAYTTIYHHISPYIDIYHLIPP